MAIDHGTLGGMKNKMIDSQAPAESPARDLRSTLDKILDRTVDWVKFAEAKNGILLTVNAAAAAATIGWLSASPGPPSWLVKWVFFTLAALIVSILLALTSFLPVLEYDFLKLTRRHGHADSVLYFGAIAGCSADSYLTSLIRVLEIPEVDVDPISRDYAGQIVVNAQIATAKFRLFKFAAWVSLAAVVAPSLRALVHLA